MASMGVNATNSMPQGMTYNMPNYSAHYQHYANANNFNGSVSQAQTMAPNGYPHNAAALNNNLPSGYTVPPAGMLSPNYRPPLPVSATSSAMTSSSDVTTHVPTSPPVTMSAPILFSAMRGSDANQDNAIATNASTGNHGNSILAAAMAGKLSSSPQSPNNLPSVSSFSPTRPTQMTNSLSPNGQMHNVGQTSLPNTMSPNMVMTPNSVGPVSQFSPMQIQTNAGYMVGQHQNGPLPSPMHAGGNMQHGGMSGMPHGGSGGMNGMPHGGSGGMNGMPHGGSVGMNGPTGSMGPPVAGMRTELAGRASSSESDTSGGQGGYRRPLQPWEQELEIDISSPSSLSSFNSEYNSLADSMYIPSPSPNSHHPMNGDGMWHHNQHGHIQVKIEDTSEASTTTHSPLHGLKKKQRCLSTGSSQSKGVEEELCLICGDRASGYHYNALSCEGCKGFFRRSITKGASYACKYGGHCEMDMWMRRKCQSCRLRRCREVGMKEECLLSDDQCKARDARRKARQRLLKVQQPMSNDSMVASPPESIGSADYKDSSPQTPGSDDYGPVSDPLNYISSEEKELIERIVFFQDKYELPSENDVKNVAEVRISDLGRPQELSEQIYKNMAEMTILVTQLVVEFAKQLPGFSEINREDQIILLKGSASEVMMLRTARRYDMETDTIIFGNGTPMTKESLRFGGLQDYVDGMFHFCHGMGKLAVDNAEYALLTALTILSERPGLTQPKQVEEKADLYLNTLISYEKFRRAKKDHYLAKLLQKLTDLRTLSIEHADILFSLKVEKGSLPPLLCEYFDVV